MEDGEKKLPSPASLPILGNALQLGGPRMHQQLCQWADELGGIYVISAPGKDFVVVSDVEIVSQLLAPEPKGVPKNTPLYADMNNLASPNSYSNLMTYSSSEQWRLARKTLDPAFAPEALPSLFPTIKTHILRLISQVQASAERKAQQGSIIFKGQEGSTVFNVADLGVRMLMDISGKLFWDVDVGTIDDINKPVPMLEAILRARIAEVNKAQTPASHFMASIPILPSSMQHRKDLDMIHSQFGRVYEHLRNLKCPMRGAGVTPDVPCALKSLRDYRSGEAMSLSELISNIGVLGLSGSFPPGLTAAYTLYEIAAHREVQDKLVAELATAGLLGKPEEFTQGAVQGLKYLQACVKEAMRFHTIVPMLNRIADRDMTLKGYKIPQATELLVLIAGVHNSKHNYTDPRKFWPERWELTEDLARAQFGKDESSRASPIGNLNNLSGSFIPFSSGDRTCIGQHIATLAISTFVGQMMAAFDLGVDPSTGTPEEVAKQEHLAINVYPSKPIFLLFTPRK